MPVRPRSQLTAPASTDDARERILAAAERCIARHGIRKTTMDDIASEAGLSRPSVYRYFADRNDLLIELNTRHAVAARPGTQIDLTDEQPLWPTDATGRRLPGLVKDVRFIEIAGGPHKIGRTHPGEVNKAFGSAA